MKSALTTTDNAEKLEAQSLASFKEKTFDELTEEDKNTLLKFIFERFDLIKKA